MNHGLPRNERASSTLNLVRPIRLALSGVATPLMARIRFALPTAVMFSLVFPHALCAQSDLPLVPETVPLHESARRALAAEWLNDDERADLRVFHGVWDERDLDSPRRTAQAALLTWDLHHPIFENEAVDSVLRAEAAFRAGDLSRVLALLDGVESAHAGRLRAESLEELGDLERADRAVDQPVRVLLSRQLDDPAELTEGVRALFVRSRLQGQPSRDFQTMLTLLARAHQEIDRLYWPAMLAEAELLFEKDQMAEAVDALHQALQLNPRASEVWYMLGRIALDVFDFASASRAAANLQRLNPDHPLSHLLLAEARLIQDDPDSALELLEPLIERFPKIRRSHALHAAAQALFYDEQAMQHALDHYDELSPGSARAYYTTGRHLALNRQYDVAAKVLEEAIRRQPKWPAPQIEQGLMELQSGRDAVALSILRSVTRLDPFNKRAINSLNLLEELAEYERIETEHFIIRYRPGIDRVMVELMPEPLEEIHRVVTQRFGFEPDRRTIIEVMPDHQRFAVRITGMPFVHTIAACTGPVIAMEVPREGRLHTGIYDWPRVVQHEYTHTVTLAQTRNRIPHWLTEAAAVEMELAPRDYETWKLLARSYQDGTLFDLDEIKWAFVRPRRPGDRSKAYAQGHWMLEYMNDRFGESGVLLLLERYFEGDREAQAFPRALGVSRESFFRDFLAWAGSQLRNQGLLPEPSMTELMDSLREADAELSQQMADSRHARLATIADGLGQQIGQPKRQGIEPIRAADWPPLRRPPVDISDDQLTTWIEKYPHHPDLLELAIRRALRDIGRADASLIPMLERYAMLRPVDPFPHKRLAQIYLASDSPHKAIPHLEALDAREQYAATFAIELARLYREQGDLERAFERALRAVHINPYHAPHRELLAAIAVEARLFRTARQHIEALTILEPDRPQHQRRLEAIERLLSP